MKELSTKYGIEDDKLKRLVKDGWMPTTAPFHDEVYSSFKEFKAQGAGTEDAVMSCVARHNLNRSTVYNIISKF